MVTTTVKFLEGGWVTLLATSRFIGLCVMIRRYYTRGRRLLGELATVDWR